MATRAERKTIDGQWTITWRPDQSTPHTGTATLATRGEGLKVELDSTLGSGTAEGAVEGNRLSWTITLGDSRSPLQFDALVEGDEISGRVQGGPGFFRDASLEGTRVGSKIQVRSRQGSDAMAETLKKCGVEYVFGYLEGSAYPSFLRSIISHDIPNMAGRTELSAAWMSYGYNRVKRRAASGALLWCVGALHASPVVYAAKLDSTPLLFLAVEHSAAWDMREILQDAGELYSALKPLSKYIKKIVDAEDMPLAVRQAVMAASTGKFGPAVLNLTHPAALQRTTIKSEELILPSPPAASEQDVIRALEMIKQAKNPVLLVGAGVHRADAAAELRSFAEAMGVPVVSSVFGGRGVLPDDHPLYAGDMGLMTAIGRGSRVAQQADLWIAIGFSFSETATFSWRAAKPDDVIHVDVEENQIGRIFQPSLGIVADAKVFLSQLNSQVKASGSERSDYLNTPRIVEIQKAKELGFQQLSSALGSDPLTPLTIGAALTEEAPDGALIVGDEGFLPPGMVYRESKYPSGMAPALGFHYASLGATLPVSIGAKLAEPERVVISYGGDGGFYYDCMDLSLLAQHNLKVIVIINNNYGVFGGRQSGVMPLDTSFLDLPETSDFAAVARGFGVEAEPVEKSDQLIPALRRAVAADGPYLLDVRTDTRGFYENFMSSILTGEDAPKNWPAKSVEGSWPS